LVRYLKLVLFTFAVYFPIFLKLDYLPIRDWDEARTAVQVYEMIKSGNYLVTTFEFKPDLWYTKPPLLVWFQVLTVKLFGYNELGIRLPVALSVLLTVLTLTYSTYKYLKSDIGSFAVGLSLVCFGGFISIHGARTADVDAFLTMWFVLYSFSFFHYLVADSRSHLYLFSFFASMALLTKGVAGLFFMPGIFLYVLHRRKLIGLLRNKHFYFSLIIVILPLASYYVARDFYNPGYLKAVWQNEWIGRYGETIEGHKGGFFYYVNRILDVNHPILLLFSLLGIIFGLRSIDDKVRELVKFTFILFLSFLALISFSNTKPYWYDVPLYSLLALFCGIGIYYSIKFFLSVLPFNKVLNHALLFLIPLIFLSFPYHDIYRNVSKRGEIHEWDIEYYSLSYLLRDKIRSNDTNLSGFSIVYDGYVGHLLPYVYRLNDKGVEIGIKRSDTISLGDKIIVHTSQMQQLLNQKFNLVLIASENKVNMYQVFP